MLNTSNKPAPAFTRAIALARRAANAASSENERATATETLAAHCIKHKLDVATVLATAAQPDTGITPLDAVARVQRAARAATTEKPADAPKPEAAKPAKPSKPSAADAKRASDYDARVKLIGELRATTASIYNGPSLAVRSNPKRVAASVYADLHKAPKHRTTLAKLSERDESFLFAVIKRGSASGSFDPVALNLDAGIFSRLCSVGFVTPGADGTYQLTADALSQARRTAKAAKAA